MKEITIKLYQYDELSEKAKEKALNWYMSSMDIDYQFAWDNVKDSAKDIGLDLKGVERGYMKGDFTKTAEECANKILKEYGKECEIYKTASGFIKELKRIEEATNKQENGEESDFNTEAEIENAEMEFRQSLLEDYRVISEKEEEFISSKEQIEENIKINEYTFLENGERFGA
jgi:hypothetical protein